MTAPSLPEPDLSPACADPDMMQKMSAAIAALSMEAVEQAKSGHPGMPMGMADVAAVLFSKFLKFDATMPGWADRDRFVLSAGHGSMLIYALAYLLGYEDMPIEEIKSFRQLGARTAGHPEYGHAPAVEVTTGPLGQGIANAVGLAIAEAHLRAHYGADLVNHFTYVIAGDGCLMEGISQEAISLAGHLALGKLIVFWDDNEISIDGPVSLADSTDQLKRFSASGWDVARIDGHDMAAIAAAIEKAQSTSGPSLIACRTIIGKGADQKAGTAGVHGAPLGAAEIEAARRNLGWDHPPFEIPADILAAWRQAGRRGKAARQDWEGRLESAAQGTEFRAALSGALPAALAPAMAAYKDTLISSPQKVATRKASQMALEVINKAVPMTIGGSADLTGSNNTKAGGIETLDAQNPGGRYLHYGIREHAMAAAMNGMALHGGVIPYGGTFMVFTDYCRPAIRLSALMGQRVIYVMTHDSIGLGEDGPTHQPVEHLAALRAMPNLAVFRPADGIETAECWEAALGLYDMPSILALSRQGLAPLRLEASPENKSLKGAYLLAGGDDAYDITLFASGSEVEIVMAARAALIKENIAARVVSVPCIELFLTQSESYRCEMLGDRPRLAVEAGIRQGWDFILSGACVTKEGRGQAAYDAAYDFIGMTSFGASAPAADLYRHFGITADAVVEKAKSLLRA